ncbi:hypothetical protein AMK59_6836, partial [Oryctes borbonicus]
LCGTFNENQKDDFLTPENDVEKSVIAFANKWKLDEKCNDVPDAIKSHPCDTNVINRAIAEKYCKRLKAERDIFQKCHAFIDPETFYQDCLFDMCSCEGKLATCLCPILGAYVDHCSLQSVRDINWRNEIKECGIHCPGGQIYQTCGNSCTRSCYDISSRLDCKEQCVEGCNCPPGEALNEHGECIPTGQCGCQRDGFDFRPGYNETRPGPNGPEICTCGNGRWNCVAAPPGTPLEYNKLYDEQGKCSTKDNFEFTTCESPEPVTCKNMHNLAMVSAAVCHPGCQCKDGYVLDQQRNICVKPSECPCHHGGKSYGENAIVQVDCNTCTCKGGHWLCTERQCAGECSAWGDSHYKTFDGKHYDYQGQCDYVLAKGALNSDESFVVTTQNVPCGTTGVSCSKSIKIEIGGNREDSIVLTQGKKFSGTQKYKHFSVRSTDLFIIIEATNLGLIVQWDRGTRVYIKLQPRWKNRVKGLCGNFNENEADDFQTPSGGVVEASAYIFGNSWKTQATCIDPEEIIDTCEMRPDRRTWALKKCGVLKTSPFLACHSEVPVDSYYENCLFDTCACDQGGDCECLCTALAAYAQECNTKGVPIKWRSQELCPIQCDERCAQYTPCISSCPQETCDNLLKHNEHISRLCKEDSCIEGCQPKPCPPGQVYLNTSLSECVPRNICKVPCMKVGDTVFYEGDVISEDDCQTCHCLNGRESCVGVPCTTIRVETETPPSLMGGEQVKCKSGWTEWINKNKGPTFSETNQGGKLVDVEPLPTSLVLNTLKGEKVFCNQTEMAAIECRTVLGHIPAKETGLDVECSLENGLLCTSGTKSCVDFEIRVLCRCEKVEITTEKVPTPTATPSTVHPPECDLVTPFRPIPNNCSAYYHCVSTTDGPKEILEICEGKLLFNPVLNRCDLADEVYKINKDCLNASLIPCADGFIHDDCAIQCDKLCSYYQHTVVVEQKQCKKGKKCEKGCRPINRPDTCPPGYLWRNQYHCVSVADCLCASQNGTAVKPGDIVQEDECTKCQCVNDYYGCDNTLCLTTYRQTTITTTEKKKITQGTTIGYTEEQTTGVKIPLTTEGVPIGFTEEETTYTTGKEVERVTTGVTETTMGTTYGEVETSTEFLASTSVTPPAECNPAQFINLIQADRPLPDNAFSASSILNDDFLPHYARIEKEPIGGGSWKPSPTDEYPYLQVSLNRLTPIYGVIIKGNPVTDEYITSYKVSYIDNVHQTFSFITSDGKTPQIFRGPINSQNPTREIFKIPFEAKAIRIHPVTYEHDRAMQLDIIGCSEYPLTTEQIIRSSTEHAIISTTTTAIGIVSIAVGTTAGIEKETSEEETYPPEVTVPGSTERVTTPKVIIEVTTEITIIPTVPVVCDDAMGLGPGHMSPRLITQSSYLKPSTKVRYLDIHRKGAWQPYLNSPTEWVMFNFTGPRNITGMITRGGPNGFVQSYKLLYSNNLADWNSILDENGEEKIFPANVDNETPVGNYFPAPIRTTYLKLVPQTWHDNIQLRAEPRGCYEPYKYPEVEEELPLEVCPFCPTVPVIHDMECLCEPELYWSGEDCVKRNECPCVEKDGTKHKPKEPYIKYKDCLVCTCRMGGREDCEPMKCDIDCPGQVVERTATCNCTCKSCAPNEVYCPTSKICIDAQKWCDGVIDCQDDEEDCVPVTTPETLKTSEVQTTVTSPTPPVTVPQCLKKTCPPNYELRQRTQGPLKGHYVWTKMSPNKYAPKTKSFVGYKTKVKGSGHIKSALPYAPISDNVKQALENKCPEYYCVPPPPPLPKGNETVSCPPIVCPPGHKVEYNLLTSFDQECPEYGCVPPPPDTTCIVDGKNVNTFDNTNYQYDICNHVLARDSIKNAWNVTLIKCDKRGSCSQRLEIRQFEHLFVFYPDLTVGYNSYNYTPEQIEVIGSYSPLFSISRIGNCLVFTSEFYGFWVKWSLSSTTTIGVSEPNKGLVDGLCGYYDQKPTNDKRKPNGDVVISTVDFGDSWSLVEKPWEICPPETCPAELYKEATELCSKVKDEVFSACHNVLDMDSFISLCRDKTCTCLRSVTNNETATENCRCEALQKFVVQCMQLDSTVNVENWRGSYNCRTTCPPPLIQQDCYRRTCELTCDTVMNPSACPKLDDTCFPGCYCPPGFVRDGEGCVEIPTCKDCECNLKPDLQYITYDESNFTLNGNCVYVMSRDTLPSKESGHNFQVLITNAPCEKNSAKICVNKVTIFFAGKRIHIFNSPYGNKLKVTVDGAYLADFVDVAEWLGVTETKARDLIFTL